MAVPARRAAPWPHGAAEPGAGSAGCAAAERPAARFHRRAEEASPPLRRAQTTAAKRARDGGKAGPRPSRAPPPAAEGAAGGSFAVFGRGRAKEAPRRKRNKPAAAGQENSPAAGGERPRRRAQREARASGGFSRASWHSVAVQGCCRRSASPAWPSPIGTAAATGGRGAGVVSSQAAELAGVCTPRRPQGHGDGRRHGRPWPLDRFRWSDGTLRVWNAGSGALIRTIELDEGAVTRSPSTTGAR